MRAQRNETPTANSAIIDVYKDELTQAILSLYKTDFLVFQKSVLGFEIGPQHKIWWQHLKTGEDVCEMAPRDHGKLLSSDTKVLTVEGWKTHGDLRIGHRVFNKDGIPTKVIGVSKLGFATLKVTTSIGEIFYCHPHHEWEVYDRKNCGTVVIETGRMLNLGLLNKGESRYVLKRSYNVRNNVFSLTTPNPFFSKPPEKLTDVLITRIESCTPRVGQCIEIMDTRGVYLVGEKLIPTHNSYSLALAYPLWKLKYDPWVREVLILGADQPSAIENLDKIKNLLNTNRCLNEMLPSRSDGIYSRTEISLVGGKKIKAKGIGSPLRGRHPQLIILDDILNEKNSNTDDLRSHIINYFNEVIVPMKDKGLSKDKKAGHKSQIVVIGTAQHYNDLYHYLISNPQYLGEKLKAVVSFEDKEVLWSERYTFKDMMDMKERVGNISFLKEYQNEPTSDDTTLFPYSLFEPLLDEDLSYVESRPRDTLTYLGADFSVPGNLDGDYTVIVVLSYDSIECKYTLCGFWRSRPKTLQEQLDKISLFSSKYSITLGYLEDNMFQKIYKEHFKHNSNLPLKGVTVTSSGKKSLKSGVLSLRPLLENEKMIFPYKTEEDKRKTDLLVREFSGVRQKSGKVGNSTSHDDIVMAVWHAITASRGCVFEADFGD
jgi:hypothetical protein